MNSNLNLFFRVFSFLTPKDKFNYFRVIFLNLIMGLLDVVTIASTVPILDLLSNKNNNNLKFINNISFLKFEDPKFIEIGFLLFVIIIFSLATIFKLYTVWNINRFIEGVRHTLSVRILNNYLEKEYEEIYFKDSSEIAKLILSEVDQFIIYVFSPTILMIAGFIISIIIFIFLIYSSPIGSLISISAIVIFYCFFYFLVRKPLKSLGFSSSESNKLRFKYATEALRSFKDIKIYGGINYFLSRYRKPSKKFAITMSSYTTIDVSSKYILEFIAFAGLIILTLFLSINSTNKDNLSELPIIGTFAFAAYKSQPSLTAIFHGISSLKYGTKMIDNIYKELNENKNFYKDIKKNNSNNKNYSIIFDRVSYSYEKDSQIKNVFHDLSINIPKKGLIVLLGPSGIGKSTFLDLILGLVKPTSGMIFNNHFYKNKISYLHQNFVLFNGSIISNIAFGIEKNNIDYSRIKNCLKLVNLYDYVKSLPQGVETIVGESGNDLSGGQKQRIGIARCLYLQSEILILDEPTSALDSKNENKIFNELKKISKEKLVIVSTHKNSNIPSSAFFIRIKSPNNIEICSDQLGRD
tara:strand:+ start:12114 stop:13853 length:1740 start_codon:yes stop_codon:yes gene_type:complete